MNSATESQYLNEIAVIGDLLVDDKTLSAIDDALTVEDFENDVCGAVLQAALELRDAGESIDAVTIRSKAENKVKMSLGDFFVECMDYTPTAVNVEMHCRIVKEASLKRKMLEHCNNVRDGVFGFAELDELLQFATESLDKIQQSATSEIVDSKQMAEAWCEYYEKVRSNPDFAVCKTHYEKLDKQLGGGLFKHGLYIVGARPGMGKTTLGINMAQQIASFNKSVLFVSLEMTREQIMAKRMAVISSVGYTKLMAGGLPDEGVEYAKRVAGVLAEQPFYLLDKGGTSVADIGRAARKIKELSAIFVDYIGLVSVPEKDEQKPRYEQMTGISADLKALAKRLGVPIVVLCQLNRENAKDKDKRPQLQHLRDSGSIEQDADCVILLHREEYYKDKESGYTPPEAEDIELIVAKNRHGETGKVTLSWVGKTGEIKERMNPDGI